MGVPGYYSSRLVCGGDWSFRVRFSLRYTEFTLSSSLSWSDDVCSDNAIANDASTAATWMRQRLSGVQHNEC